MKQQLVLLLCCLSCLALAGQYRCSVSEDDKTVCQCSSWTGRPSCTPLVVVADQDECRVVGGIWGHEVRAMHGYGPQCNGKWRDQPSRRKAVELYDAIMSYRESSRTTENDDETQFPRHLQQPSLKQIEDSNQVLDSMEGFEGSRDIIVSPSFGPTSGGVWVQIIGAGSYHVPNSLQCKLDLIEQYCYSNHYMYTWCYLTPKCAGVFDFNCVNGPLKFHGMFAVVAKTPWVTSVYPYSGDTSGGTQVIVRGWNFEPHCPSNLLCRFGNSNSTIVPAKYYTSSSIQCISPCGNSGFVSVEVSNDGGNHWSMSGVQFGYVGDHSNLNSLECRRYRAVGFDDSVVAEDDSGTVVSVRDPSALIA